MNSANKSILTSLLIIILALIPLSCRQVIEPVIPIDPEPVLIEYSGRLILPEDDAMDPSTLEIVSSHEIKDIEEDGSFSIRSHASEKFQLYFITPKESDETLYFGLSEPEGDEIIANDSITAIGLLLFNPSLIGALQEHREDYIAAAVQHPDFKKLISQIRVTRKQQGEVSANVDKNPILTQYVTQIMVETMQKLASGSRIAQLQYYAKSIQVLDGPGNKIKFRNWRHVYYAANIHNITTGEKTDVLLDRIVKAITWRWWLPGIVVTTGENTYKEVEDGNLLINCYKWNWRALDDNNAEGQASRYNTLLTAYYITDMIIGAGDFKKSSFDKLERDILWSNAKSGFSMSMAANTDDFNAVINANIEFIIANAKPLITVFTHGNEEKVMKLTGKAWNNIFKAITVAGWLNEHVPFFIDLIRGPNHLEFKYRQKDGVLTKVSENIKPYAEMSFSPQIGYGNTHFTLDAIEAEDDFTPVDSLLIRWQVGDNAWTNFSHDLQYQVTLDKPTRVRLEVMDEDGAVVEINQYIPFYESVKRTRIVALISSFEDDYKEYFSNDLGFNNQGDLQHLLTGKYEHQDVTKFNISLLNPETDLLIFSPYVEGLEGLLDIWQENKIGILNFVHKGGALLIIMDESTDYNPEANSNNVLPFQINRFNIDRQKVIQAGDATGDFYDFTGEAKAGNGWYYATVDVDHKTSYIFNEEEGLIHLRNELDEPLLVEKHHGRGIMMGAIFSPRWPEEEVKICTNIIKYLVAD